MRELVSSVLEPGISGSLNELCNEMIYMSGLLARIRQRDPPDLRCADDLSALDAAFGRSIKLARGVNERLGPADAAGEVASLSLVVREVVQLLMPSLAWEGSVRTHLPPSPVLVTARRADLRWLVATLIGYAVDLIAFEGELVIDVRSDTMGPPGVVLEVRCRLAVPLRDSALELDVRPTVTALGGTLELHDSPGGESRLILRLPSVSNRCEGGP